MFQSKQIHPTTNTRQGYFPSKYFVDFLKFVRRNSSLIQIITYNDLPWDGDNNYKENYPDEFQNWQRMLRERELDPDKIYLLLQHDVDSYPELTLAILREEELLGIPSNVMIFNRAIDRNALQKKGEIKLLDYHLDYPYLKSLQDQARFVFGYHCNAYGQARFDMVEATRIFEEDIAELRRHLDIHFFSPHGGVKDQKGLSNYAMSVPESLESSLKWVHNRYTVRFNGYYSDGALNSDRNPSDLDLRKFVGTWRRGNRYRVLTHPQYYHTEWIHAPRLQGADWYEEVLNHYANQQHESIWETISL
ncbi:MAG: hypothetical protein M3362_11925 [Acidobacteriota bacterium]|nr:hypothetical protein [Acidobacteriota bacterium]